MRRRRREIQSPQVLPQDSKIYFNIEQEFSRDCAICYRTAHHMVHPCQCSTGYHEECLLLYIQRRILLEIREKEDMDISSLKCMRCGRRFYLLFRHECERSCSKLCDRLRGNCCNVYVILMAIVLIAIVVTAALTLVFMDENSSSGVQYGLVSALVV